MYSQRRMWGIVSVVGMGAAVLITLGLAFRALPVQARPAQGNSGQQIRVMFQETATPGPSVTPQPSMTHTITTTPSITLTATATPPAVCSLVTFDSARLIDTYLEINIRNGNADAPVFISRVELQWNKHAAFPNMYTEEMKLYGRTRFWVGPDYDPPTNVDATHPNWNYDSSGYASRRFDPFPAITTLRVRFSLGPADLGYYFTLNNFSGTRLYFSTTWGGPTFDPVNDCMVEIGNFATNTPTPSPTPITYTPTPSPTANCADFSAQLASFEANGVVKFEVTNNGVNSAYITGFHINSNTYNRVLAPITPLDFVSVGGPTAFDPAAVVMWNGSATALPLTAASGDPGWQTNPEILPGATTSIWFDFDGTLGSLDDNLGYYAYDFDDTWFMLSGACNAQLPDQFTPTHTPTPTPSFTATPGPSPTPLAECGLLTFENARMVDNFVEIDIRNANATAPVYLKEIVINWSIPAAFPYMYANEIRIVGHDPFWIGPAYHTIYSAVYDEDHWNSDISTQFDPDSITTLRIGFINGPTQLSDTLPLGMINGSWLSFSKTIEGFLGPCDVVINNIVDPPTPTPTLITYTPTSSPTPDCANFSTQFVGFELNGVVHFTVTNRAATSVYITGFHINRNTYNRPLEHFAIDRLDYVAVGGVNAYDPAAVLMWGANEDWGTYDVWLIEVLSESSSHFVNTIILPNTTTDVWVDFDYTTLPLSDLGYRADDFNDSWFRFSGDCISELPDQLTPTPTFTPSITLTPSNTFTPSPSNTPTETFTPSPTFTPSWTPPPSQTPVPTETRTPTRTRTPTATRTPSPTVIPSATRTDIPNYTLIPGCISYGESSTIICGAQ